MTLISPGAASDCEFSLVRFAGDKDRAAQVRGAAAQGRDAWWRAAVADARAPGGPASRQGLAAADACARRGLGCRSAALEDAAACAHARCACPHPSTPAQVYKGYANMLAVDVADTVVYAATRPPRVQVAEITVTSVHQSGARLTARPHL